MTTVICGNGTIAVDSKVTVNFANPVFVPGSTVQHASAHYFKNKLIYDNPNVPYCPMQFIMAGSGDRYNIHIAEQIIRSHMATYRHVVNKPELSCDDIYIRHSMEFWGMPARINGKTVR